MFYLGSGGLLSGQHDCNKEREPPSRPTPVILPSLGHIESSREEPPISWSKDSTSIPARFLAIRKPTDVGSGFLATLNISIQPPCGFESLLVSAPEDGQTYFPPPAWFDPPEEPVMGNVSQVAPSACLLSNGKPAPGQKEFYLRAKELQFPNDEAFACLSRKPNPGQTALRLAHFRRFWEGLDNMAYYWDTSKDVYLPPKTEDISNGHNGVESSFPDSHKNEQDSNGKQQSSQVDEEPRKKPKTSDERSFKLVAPFSQSEGNSTSIQSSKALPARTAPPKVPWAPSSNQSEKQTDLSKGSYRGYRIGNGTEMPEQYRLECVRSFVESIAWAFGVTFVPHRRPPVLCIQNVRFPVRMNTAGWRPPNDRMKARQGCLEGPVIGLQCRPETNFGASGSLENDSILDVVRELGGLLFLAQERARHGKTETRPGEGKWWTTQPRWGGGPGGEVGEATGGGDDPQEKPDGKPEKPKKQELSALQSRLLGGGRGRGRVSPAEAWKTLKPGAPLWDPKITYELIGKDANSDWDEVFMVSSVDHHISVVKLRVHAAYIRYLTEGVMPAEHEAEKGWCAPCLQRTRWYDLFDRQDRNEALRGIWGIMAYQMRSQEKPDVAMEEA